MSLFKFNDARSRKQVNIAITYANYTKQANADKLLEYDKKLANLIGSRNEWELEEYDGKNSEVSL